MGKTQSASMMDYIWQSSIYIGLWSPLVSFTKRGQPQPLLTSPVFHAPGNLKQLALQRFRSGGESSASHVLGSRKISDHPWTIKHFRNINGWSHGHVMQSYHFQIWHLQTFLKLRRTSVITCRNIYSNNIVNKLVSTSFRNSLGVSPLMSVEEKMERPWCGVPMAINGMFIGGFP